MFQDTVLAEPLNNLPEPDKQPLRPVVELLAAALEQQSFHAATTAVLAKLADTLACSGVNYGVYQNDRCTLEAASHSASMDERMNLTQAASDAMQEAINQDACLAYPQVNQRSHVMRAIGDYAQQAKVRFVFAVPVNHNGKLVGAFLFERQRGAPFDEATQNYCALVASLLGPVLESKRQEELPLRSRMLHALRQLHEELLGPAHATLKLLAGLTVLSILVLLLFNGDYRVTADAKLEGLVQRSVVAPMDGYILSAKFRAGDEVREGEILAELDDRELQLERSRWLSEKQQTQRAYRAALSQQDRTEVVILKAKLDQAIAKLELAEKILARSKIAAPLDGFVVTGDLSKSLGAPVERGDVLFEIMPVADYRVMLKVNERDIGQIAEQQRGTLALNGFPAERFAFEITRITPVSEAEDGNNFFMVEAELDDADPLLRPGMRGVAKIDAGERRLGWILTHEIFDWLRLWIWA